MTALLPVLGGSPFGLGDELVKLLRCQAGALQKLAQDEHLNAERDVWGDLVGQLGFTESSVDQPFGGLRSINPGARLFVLAAAPDVPPLTDLLRLAHALDLAAVLTYCDHRPDLGDPTKVQGERWDLRLSARDAPLGAESPFCASVELAVARCVEYLDSHLLAAVPREPERPVPAPQAAPSPPVADPTALLRRVGRRYAGQPVLVSFDRAGCRLWLAEGDHVQPLARATTLDAVVSALRLTGRE